MPDKIPVWEQFRRAMPKQFTRQTKLCAKCGQRVQLDAQKRLWVCRRCKQEY
jgi:ribosomal protein S27AE